MSRNSYAQSIRAVPTTADAWLASRSGSTSSSSTSAATKQPNVTVVAASAPRHNASAPTAAATSYRRHSTTDAAAAHSAAATDLPEVIAAGRVILPSIGQGVTTTTTTPAAVVTSGVATAANLSVLDPLVRGGKVEVPLTKTFNTKGRADWLAGKFRRDLSVCCLFHKGRCHAGERCHQVHVDRDTLNRVREAHASDICCCKACGDTGSALPEGVAFFKAVATTTAVKTLAFAEGTPSGRVVAKMPIESVAYTVGTLELLREAAIDAAGVAAMPIGRVCRLHLNGSCKYGRDCRHLHLCTKFASAFGVGPSASALPASVAVEAVATPTVQVTPVKKIADEPSVAAEAMTTTTTPAAAVMDAASTPSTVPKPLLAPAFLRANYPTLDQGSLRISSSGMGLSGLVFGTAGVQGRGGDDMELTFRPFDRLPLELSSPTYTAVTQRFADELSPASTIAGPSSTMSRKMCKTDAQSSLSSPSNFFCSEASNANVLSPQ